MSSAAVQAAQQPPSAQQPAQQSLHLQQAASAASPQSYSPATASRDRFNSGAPASSSPNSARRAAPGRTSLDNAASPQQPYSSSAAMSTPRAAASPTGAMGYGYYSTDSNTQPSLSNATLPIRTSSQQNTPTQATSAASYGAPSYSRSSQQSSEYAGENDRAGDSRRAGPRSPREEQAPGSGKSQRTRNTPTTSRSQTAVGQPPMGTELPRENSAVLNRIVVDDPQIDPLREEMRKAEARPQPPGSSPAVVPGMEMVGGPVQAAAPVPQQRSRQEHLRQASSSRKEVKFGDYILGQTLGEGEFGKVKMGWKKDSTVQVAIKLIRKESLAGNTTRLPKIYREIAILRELQHPNIVRLHEFVETERHMGIILEYASGGELFDYILNHRYLKDPAARRLFAQLVSGVGYLHRKGIVHRDLKLENLLLDRNKHIIITDFGFANTFDPNDELGEEVERHLHDKSYVKREGLDKILPRKDGREGTYRRGDLMQTSCGSPCYAAPELVVSDGLYTGRKVDVWSCGVILYAMLAGYLPFDDDPANPEGDNINLLYKYIVSTPLTFPEYVTPHARDLLRRILVPDPRKRADLFEVARHSWLSEYTHVVGFIGSSIKGEKEMVPTTLDNHDTSGYLNRSASVREPHTRVSNPEHRPTANASRHVAAASIGGDEASDIRRHPHQQQRDNKRNTVQLEYVPPFPSGRTDAAPSPTVPISAPLVGKTRTRTESQGPVEVPQSQRRQEAAIAASSRPVRDQRSTSETAQAYNGAVPVSGSRPGTGGALGSARLPSRGNSYSQPSVAQPTTTTAQGSFSQPKSSSGYIIGGTSPALEQSNAFENNGRPASHTQAIRPNQFGNFQQPSQQMQPPPRPGGHKRSSTLGSITDKILNRSNSKRASQADGTAATPTSEKRDRRYPPVSMKNALPSEDAASRASTDSRRPSFGFSRKASKERSPSVQGRRTSRRFSLLPSSFSVTNILGRKDTNSAAGDDGYDQAGRPSSKSAHQHHHNPFARDSRSPSGSTLNSTNPHPNATGAGYDPRQPSSRNGGPSYDKALPQAPGPASHRQLGTPPPVQRKQFRDDGYGSNRLEQQQQQQQQHPEPTERFYTPHQDGNFTAVDPQQHQQYYNDVAGGADEYDPNDDGYGDIEGENGGRNGPAGSLRPQQRRFGDAYEHGHGGSSSATRRVMDFFRRRGKERAEV